MHRLFGISIFVYTVFSITTFAWGDYEELMENFETSSTRLGFYAESASRCNTSLSIMGMDAISTSQDCLRIINNLDEIDDLRQSVGDSLIQLGEDYEEQVNALPREQQNDIMNTALETEEKFEEISEAIQRITFLLETQ